MDLFKQRFYTENEIEKYFLCLEGIYAKNLLFLIVNLIV